MPAPELHLEEIPDVAPVPTVNDVIECISNDDYDGARNLIEIHAVNIDQLGDAGLAPIHCLAIYDTTDELFNLIKDNTADPLMTISGDQDTINAMALPPGIGELSIGDTVLHIAAKSYDDFSALFCERFAIYGDIPNSDGDTPLDCAIFFSNLPMVVFAINSGADLARANLLQYTADYLGEGNGGEAAAEIYRIIAEKLGADPIVVENFLAEVAARDAESDLESEEELEEGSDAESENETDTSDSRSPSPNAASASSAQARERDLRGL